MLVVNFWWADKHTVQSQSVAPQIIIAQIKVSSSAGQFITLYNNSDKILDLSTIQLQYFNNYDLLKATSGKLISLSGKVPAGGYAVVDDGPIQACYQMTVNSVSLGLSSTAGLVQVSHFLGATSPQVVSILDDYVGWSKTATVGAEQLPSSDSFLQRHAPDGSRKYANISIPGSGDWEAVRQPDGSVPCAASSAAVASGGGLLGTSSAPIPYTVIAGAQIIATIPATDAGLAAPRISEVLPNPAPPHTDADDEFIELYNPNPKAFDLSGFTIQVGTTTLHKYTFPSGTTIGPKKFLAFYSSDTGLSLSNSESRVAILDPGGNLLEKTDEYSSAKDGYTWVNAGGLWQWTTKPTPGAANVVLAPPAPKASATSAAGIVEGAHTLSGSVASYNGANQNNTARVHPLVLAGIGSAALLYALYEYRHDMANQLYKFRRHRAARRTAGQLP